MGKRWKKIIHQISEEIWGGRVKITGGKIGLYEKEFSFPKRLGKKEVYISSFRSVSV